MNGDKPLGARMPKYNILVDGVTYNRKPYKSLAAALGVMKQLRLGGYKPKLQKV